MSSAQTLANQINAAGQQYDQLRQSVNTQLTNTVTQINSYTQQIAQLNGQIAAASTQGQPPNQLLDQRDLAVSNLSQLIGVQRREQQRQLQRLHGQRPAAGVRPPTATTWVRRLRPATPANCPCSISARRVRTRHADAAEPARQQDRRRHARRPARRSAARRSIRREAQLGAIAASFAAQVNAQNALGIDADRRQGWRAVLGRQPDRLCEHAQHRQCVAERVVRESRRNRPPATTRCPTTAPPTR